MSKVAAVGCLGGLTWLMLTVCAVQLRLSHAADSWQRLPTLDTFANYEDMQRYFDQRNLRSMRHIENPSADSYLAAFNQDNGQQADVQQRPHLRTKREQRLLPTAPRMLRFELADAVEPSAELKQLVRQYNDRALKQQPTLNVATAQPTAKSRRSRRSATDRQPANFKVQMFPFEASDAREPDAATAALIKQARALDIQRQTARPVDKPSSASKTTAKTTLRIRKTKRSKRSTAPQFVKFELADAKSSLPSSLQRASKQLPVSTLLTMETQAVNNQSQVAATQPTRLDDNLVSTGETEAESKRVYVYKEAPVTHIKSKKSLSTLPHEVQKVITHLIKEGHGGKAYIKYLPVQKGDYEHFKSKGNAYSHKPLTYIKYTPAKSVEPAQVHIQPVPVVEQLRYIYKPSYAKVYAATPTIAHPIVVQEPAPAPAPAPAAVPAAVPEEVHHTYSAELAVPEVQTVTTIAEAPHIVPVVPQFRPSKPDPLQAELLQPNTIYGKPIEQYQYEVHTQPSPAPAPMIKIEYHAPADGVNVHYKELPEFRHLSTLIGKSPDDQIHGLTYLLAKEMQSKLNRQPKQLLIAQPHERPQDNTAPILFHPSEPQAALPAVKLGVQPGRLIGMAKTKQYVPIVEPGNNDVKELPLPANKMPTPSSFIEFRPGHGLSHGYEGVRDERPLSTVEHIVHHLPVKTQHEQQHGLLATTLPAELESEKSANGLHYVHNHDDKSLHQYASKYAFGYRIRDFHTGNDFGHKQNRDLHGVTRGQYHILLPDGRIQNVIYHADDTGFHADVSFEGGMAH